MYKQAAYLYPNIQSVYTDLVAIRTGYRKMYARTLNLYKGIDNTFIIKLLNGDQKPIGAVGQILFWNLLDKDTSEVVFQTSVTVEGGFNSLVPISISESNLESIKGGKYIYSTYLVDNSNKKTILYGDSQYGATVPVEVISNAFPQIYPSQQIVNAEFINSEVIGDRSQYTSALNAYPENNNHNNLHTVVFNFTNYTGNINIETTLENGVTDITNWVTIKTINVTNNDSIKFSNFYGVFNWVRFKMLPDVANTGTVDKILYRS